MTFCRMSRGLLVQMNGWGWCCDGRRTHRWRDQFGHAAAAPLSNDIAERALNHIQPRRGGGVKYMFKRGGFASQARTARCLCVA
jgi:hypothetical protein